MSWSKEAKNIFKKRYGGFNKHFNLNDLWNILNDWNDDYDEIYPFQLFDRNEADITSGWIEENDISYVNCVYIKNGKSKKHRKLSLEENDKINLTVKKSELATIEEILCFDDCRCIILDKTNKKRPTFYICLDKQNKKINRMLDLFREFVKKQVPLEIKQNIKNEKALELEEKEEKQQEIRKKQYKSMLKKGIYHMLDDDSRVFFEISTRANGFLSGELITLAYTTNVPVHAFALNLHRDLWDVLGRTKKDVLFLTANDKHFFTDIVKDIFEDEYDNECLNNIGLNITDVRVIEAIVITKKPKIIIVDNLQNLNGNSAANVRALRQMCRKYKITCFCLFEMNNVNPKKVPDISKIGVRSGIVDSSDKVFIIWNIEQMHWYRTFDDYDKLNPEFDYDQDGELKLEEDGSKPKGHKEKLYIISVDCVKNRRYKLFREFLWYCEYDNNLSNIEKKHKKELIYDFKELFGDGSYDGFDTRPIVDAINDLSSSIRDKEIPEFDGFVWNLN